MQLAGEQDDSGPVIVPSMHTYRMELIAVSVGAKPLEHVTLQVVPESITPPTTQLGVGAPMLVTCVGNCEGTVHVLATHDREGALRMPVWQENCHEYSTVVVISVDSNPFAHDTSHVSPSSIAAPATHCLLFTSLPVT